MEHQDSMTSTEAERLLSIASKLLQSSDLTGAREFSLLAQETDPLLDGSDQILAVADVLIAVDKTRSDGKPDHYSVLQIDPLSGPTDIDAIRKHYRRLALLLHPDKNGAPNADVAFRHVAEAWAVLSDPAKKSVYDRKILILSLNSDTAVFYLAEAWEVCLRQVWGDFILSPNSDTAFQHVAEAWAVLSDPAKKSAHDRASGLGSTGVVYSKVDLREAQQKLPVRRPVEEEIVDSFWTACPYCYRLYEYLRVYEDCCLRCQNCQKAFSGVTLPSLPPFVPGREAYYCNYNIFPLKSAVTSGKSDTSPKVVTPNNGVSGMDFVNGAVTQSYVTPTSSGKKRGRPRKYPVL